MAMGRAGPPTITAPYNDFWEHCWGPTVPRQLVWIYLTLAVIFQAVCLHQCKKFISFQNLEQPKTKVFL